MTTTSAAAAALAASRTSAPDAPARATALIHAARLLLQTINIARLHFNKEEQVLFAMAHHGLGSDGLAQLGQQWAERRGVILNGDEA